MESGFVKASSDNLPLVDVFMVAEFLKTDDRFTAPEIRGAKALSASRESYGDKAIGYVQLKREGPLCYLKGRICPEHRVRNKPYAVTLTVNEKEEKIINVQCLDCAAAEGGCKHALAFLMWVHRRSEEPSPTEVTSYWTKPAMAQIGTSLKFITAKELGEKQMNIILPNNSNTLKEILSIGQKFNIESQLSPHSFGTTHQRFEILSVFKKMLLFYKEGGTSPHDFRNYLALSLPEKLCSEAEKQTREQNKSPLWHELRYGRITASKLHEASKCHTANGTFVESVIGGHKIQTPAMTRGILLEKEVRTEVEKKIKKKLKTCGFILIPHYSVFGASPDAVADDFVIEIKCPASSKSVKSYINNGIIANKYKAQIQLQMLAAKKQKGLFCVASPDFEKSRNVTIINVVRDDEYLNEVIEEATKFWDTYIFPKLLEIVKF